MWVRSCRLREVEGERGVGRRGRASMSMEKTTSSSAAEASWRDDSRSSSEEVTSEADEMRWRRRWRDLTAVV